LNFYTDINDYLVQGMAEMARRIVDAEVGQDLGESERPDEAVLDRIYDRFATSDPFQPVTGFVDHVTMGAEALVALGLGAKAESWASHSRARPYRPPTVGLPISSDWPKALGRKQCHGDWIAHFDAELQRNSFEDVLARWVPRFSHDMGALLFHGVIRTGHATRALQHRDTPARRAELARGLALWAIGIRNAASDTTHGSDPAGDAAIGYARIGASCFVSRPSIVMLHYVTGPMAYLLMSKYLDGGARRIAFESFNRTHASLTPNLDPTEPPSSPEAPTPFDRARILALAEQPNVHAIKLTEAARRAFAASGEAVFLTAAAKV
jgi:hypothetical protein